MGRRHRVDRAPFEGRDEVNALAVSPDGTLVAATTTITVQTWETATGEPGRTVERTPRSPDRGSRSRPSGTLLGIASTDKTATIWAVATGVP